MFELRYLKNVSTLRLDQHKCTGCRMCLIVCPHNVFTIENKRAVITDLDACMECGACERNCPDGALSVNAGVGCAAAILQSKIKGSEICCDCDSTQEVGCCG